MQKKSYFDNSNYKKNFSIIIPVFNEEASIFNLIDEIISSINLPNYEIIIVDDGSSDNLVNLFPHYIEDYKNIITYHKHENNCGQSKAILTGVKHSKYTTIITLDGDGQNDPSDIPKLLNIYSENNFSLVGGLRLKRKDNLKKILASKIANFIRKKLLNDDCDDTGCSLKVFDKNVFLSLPFFDGIHRYLPALFKSVGKKCYFTEVNHRSRKEGSSKYGTVDRLIKGILDMTKVIKIVNKNNKYD